MQVAFWCSFSKYKNILIGLNSLFHSLVPYCLLFVSFVSVRAIFIVAKKRRQKKEKKITGPTLNGNSKFLFHLLEKEQRPW